MILRLIPPHFLLIGALVAVGAAGIQGYRMGVKHTEARVQAEIQARDAELRERGREVREKDETIRNQERQIEGLSDELDAIAFEDGGLLECAPSPDSLRRLERGWQSDG